MAADEKQVSALIRRHEQVKRWEGSDTNLEPSSPKKNRTKVQFQDGCVFLAACSSGDKEEVEKLLQRGADINTANVDGLTALHQVIFHFRYAAVKSCLYAASLHIYIVIRMCRTN